MNSFVRRYGRGPFVGAGLFLAAALTAGWTGWRYQTLAPLPGAADAEELAMEVTLSRDALDEQVIVAALDKDPFHPERRRPTRRFRLPSERIVPVPRPQRTFGLPTNTRLMGTTVFSGGRGTAMLQQNRSTSMVRVGEQFGDLTLVEVTRESATFTAPNGSRVVIRVSRPGG